MRTVQTIASIGVEMMPAGTDVGYGWVYINKVGLRCIRRSLVVPPAGAKMPQNVLILFRAPPYVAVRGGMLPRAHSLVSAAIKRRVRLLWMTPSANRNTYSVAILVGCVPRVEALRTLTLSCNLMSCRRTPPTSKQETGRLKPILKKQLFHTSNR